MSSEFTLTYEILKARCSWSWGYPAKDPAHPPGLSPAWRRRRRTVAPQSAELCRDRWAGSLSRDTEYDVVVPCKYCRPLSGGLRLSHWPEGFESPFLYLPHCHFFSTMLTDFLPSDAYPRQLNVKSTTCDQPTR